MSQGSTTKNDSSGSEHDTLIESPTKMYHQTLKARLARYLTDLKDQTRVKDMTFRDDRRRRDLRYQLEKAQTGEAIRAYNAQPTDERLDSQPDEMGDINIDSPTNIHHYPKRGMGPLARAALAAGLLALGGLGGAAAWYFLNQPSDSTTIENTEGFILELVE